MLLGDQVVQTNRTPDNETSDENRECLQKNVGTNKCGEREWSTAEAWAFLPLE